MSKQFKINFDDKQPLSKELCEFIGAFIGDGCIGKCGSYYFVQFTGHSELDKEYHLNTVIPIAKKLFNLIPSVRYIDNTIRISLYSKKLISMLHERFGMPLGPKSKTVEIPKEILNSNPSNVFFTIRGIFDTDGCVFIDKRKIYLKPYPRITLQTVSKPLYHQLKNYFNLYHRENMKGKQNAYIEVYGHVQIDKWLKLIGFSNRRHLSKLSSGGAASSA